MVALTADSVWAALAEVKDPEIPAVSMVELGMIAGVEVEDDRVRVRMTPTFVGCPAVEWMRSAAIQTIREALGVERVEVQLVYDPPWDSNRITPEGRRKLREFGLAPPTPHHGTVDLDPLQSAACPHCGSIDTVLESPFGPTLCRAIHYCNHCRQSFEQFKQL